jgi:hypothetical protein
MPSPRPPSLAAAAAVLALACSGTPVTDASAASVPPTSPADGPGASAPAAAPCVRAAGTPFCWLNPRPQGDALLGLWASGPADAWAVGPASAIARWDGRSLSLLPLPTAAPLRAVWGSAPDDVWAVGDAVLHFDGATWRAVDAPAGPWLAIAGRARDDAWMVGAAGAAARFDGAAWRAVATGSADDLTAVSVAGPGEVWAAAARGGALLRFDGTSWAPAGRVALRATAALAAAGPGEVWAAGEPDPVPPRAPAGAPLFHLAGGAWLPVPVAGLEGGALLALGARGAEVWAGGADASGRGVALRVDGAAGRVEPLPAPALPVRALQPVPGGALAAGDGGQLFARGDGDWAAASEGARPAYLQFASAAPTGAVWFATVLPDLASAAPSARLLRVGGGAVREEPVGVADVLYGVHALADDDVWAGSLRNGFLHFDGRTWTAGAGGSAGLVDGVWASGPGDVWGISGAAAVHFDGTAVTRLPFPRGSARRISGTSPRDLWAVGAPGVVQHWDGAAWTSLDVPGLVLDVWAGAADAVWMVGEDGLALRWDGRAFARVETGTGAALRAVSGRPGGAPWAVGDGGTVLRLDGARFVPVPSPTRNALAAVALDAAGRVYAGGDVATVLATAP